MSEKRAHLRAVSALTALKLVVSTLILISGFRAVSDDDFARVVIAQDFAHTPKLDPSGTSWLPVPFWINGSLMMLFGRSLDVAVLFAIVSGIVAVLLSYVAALWITSDRASAFWGAAIVAVLPWSARLGVSTVPELPTAALTLLAMGSVVRSKSNGAGSAALDTTQRNRRAVLGAGALLLATLSRYEPWFVAIGFAALIASDVLRGPSPKRFIGPALAVIVAALGPVAWIAWNQRAHGSPFHFLTRVAAYRDAIDHGSVPTRAVGYLFAVARAEPELLATAVFAVVVVRRRGRERFGELCGPFGRPVALTLFLMLALTLSSLSGGAPTHHPERALFVAFMVAALLLGHLGVACVRDRSLAPSRLTIACFVGFLAFASFPVRRYVLQSESYAERSAELDIGRAFSFTIASGEKTLLQVTDYGYFAILAASGRPEDLIPDHKILPGEAIAEMTIDDFVLRARREGFAHALGRGDPPGRVGHELPSGSRPRAQNPSYVLLDLDPITP